MGNGIDGVHEIGALLTIENPVGDTAVHVGDVPDTNRHQTTVATFINSRDSSPWGVIQHLAPADIQFKYSPGSSLSIDTSTAMGDEVDVWQTGEPTSIVTHGARAIVNVGNGDNGVQSILGSVNIAGAPGFYDTTVYIGDQADRYARTATIGTSIAGDGTLWGTINDLAPSSISYQCLTSANVYIGGGTAGDQFYVRSTPGPQFAAGVGLLFMNTTINCGGPDVVNVGVRGSMQGIQGNLTVNGAQPDLVSLNLNSQNDSTGQTVTVTDGSVVGLAPAEIDFGPYSLANLNIIGGPGGNTFNVQSTPPTEFVPNLGIAYTITTITSTGPDQVNVGNAASVAGIQGELDLFNTGGQTSLVVDDSAEAIGRGVTQSQFYGQNDGDGDNDLMGDIQFDNLASINYEVQGTSRLTLKTDPSSSTVVNILANGVSTTLVGSGPTAVNVGNGGSLADIVAPLFITNPARLTTLNLDDSAVTAPISVHVTASAITGLAPAPIYFVTSDVPSIAIDGGGNGSQYSIDSAGLMTSVVINGPAVTSLAIDDHSDTADETYTVTNTSVQRAGSPPISYGNAQGLVINGGSGSNTFDISSTALAVPVTINAGSGVNWVDVGDGSGRLGAIQGGAER